MPKVNDSKVRAIRPSGSITDYSPYIQAANSIVSQINTKCGKSFSTDRLALIETWLAAHFAGATDPIVARERFEQAEKTYQVGNRQLSGIMSDNYGQTANNLSEGCLAELDKRKMKMSSLGFTYG